ncbi:MAG TPA: hypothetical protein VM784_00425 [Actinomycetota bacterium]|nr:hypothetical protein [Actinomycetota bacterium]
MSRSMRAAAATAVAALSITPAAASPIPAQPQLWVVDADGGNETLITESWSIGAPEWSPDGTELVYAAGGLFVADADGGNPVRITPDGESALDPRWSPDGRWIAYSSHDPSQTPSQALRLISPDGRERRTIAPGGVTAIDWAPEGSRLSYVRGAPGAPGNLYTVDVGSGTETLVATGASYDWTEWAPDGSLIAFHGWDRALEVVGPDGSGRRTLSHGLTWVGIASWAPTGGEITFDSEGTIYIAARDGSGRRVLVEGSMPDWSPDGTEIAFSRAGDIFRIDVDGSDERQVTDDYLRDDVRPEWAPEVARIAFVGHPVQVLCGDFPFPIQANIIGTPEDDHLEGTPGADVIAGLDGDDVIEGLGGNDLLCGDAGSDTLVGGDGDDFLDGGRGRDSTVGGSGADTLVGAGGDDAIAGGRGSDTVAHIGAPGGVRVDLARGEAWGWGRDRLTGVENAAGWTGDDVLKGDAGSNVLRGASPRWISSGDDVLVGRGGPDRLVGRDGDDLLRGGRGNDLLDGGKHRRAGDRLRGGPGYDDCRRGENVRGCET